MSVPDPANLKPHDVAKVEIDAWRGRCLNIFSRAEKAVIDSLVEARSKFPERRLEPLSGQRLNSLQKVADEHHATDAQKAALDHSIVSWRQYDEKRPYFSHGVFTELLDRQGRWHVQMDFATVQKGIPEPRRMSLSKAEAEDLEKGIHEAFKGLARELGQLRKRLQQEP